MRHRPKDRRHVSSSFRCTESFHCGHNNTKHLSLSQAATNAWSLALLRAWMNLGTSGRGFSEKCGVSKLDLPQNNYIWKMYPPPPPCAFHPCHMHKVCRLLSSPIQLRQKFTNLKSYSQSCSRSSLCFGFWEGSCDKDFLFNNVQPPPSHCQTFLQVAATRFLRPVKPLGSLLHSRF